MKALLLLLASSADIRFHKWCNRVGIETPAASLLTTPESVAGRGVFATEDLREGDVTIRIPYYAVFHKYTAALFFPELAKEIEKEKKKFEGRNKLWRRLLGKPGNKYEFTQSSDLWQMELTKYSLACLKNNSFWMEWISQWQRSDPLQDLFDSNISSNDEECILRCVQNISSLLPNYDSMAIRAAIDIRLRRYEELKEIFDMDQSSAKLFGILTSRAIDLEDGNVGVIPMFDMVNHSKDPNLVLSFDDDLGFFELKAKRKTKKGDELFLNYKDESSDDEYGDLWTAIQWGIPP